MSQASKQFVRLAKFAATIKRYVDTVSIAVLSGYYIRCDAELSVGIILGVTLNSQWVLC